MIKKLVALAAVITLINGCSTVTNEPVKIDPFEYNMEASKNEIYFASVDCVLENISAPATSGQFFDYQDKESGRLAVAFETSYVLAFSSIPLKTTMSIRAKENNLTIRFSSLQQYFKEIGWTSVNKNKDGSKSEPELIVEKKAAELFSCISNRA
ncbi:hypothetical protein [Pseudoalteromonas sp. SW0106-04]|uniref:hypothetical protein n=1 Tax=Pseudoalteromonas sp. SW0106-04 TaxID=1702169 RepID=UPI0006B6247A|nr:hypothetical protein [Pseudoalteromonas sp. SW0106-04]